MRSANCAQRSRSIWRTSKSVCAPNCARQEFPLAFRGGRKYGLDLELELEGPYLAVLAYLEDLEALPWRLYWQVLEIDVDDYPRNRIRIEVATLSLHEEWIGV